jgi:hypothetical protein
MSTHLTQEEFTDRLLGMHSITVDAHLLDCATCRQEVERLRSSVGLFRNAARAWSESAASASSSAPARGMLHPWMLGGALLAVASIIIAVFAFYVHDREFHKRAAETEILVPERPAQATQAEIDRDNELLSQINTEIAEGIPSPMQPLQVSVSVQAASTTNQTK